ncbi:MAG: (2Fe-2S)-binding protein [Thalassobium sp.]|uniref:Bacterioferritin-associated ferredoxin n=1 Tax=Thalassolituus pacificus TaxID=2975440 RepID=A0A9X3ADA5_9GAMM|nr:(2Fe-2S)-binding protein [Thalassolituus pacificus]MCT7357482.1 (2Fe-2S)-binding protein [Thalassolituus pacificus]PHS63192.1 MAG: (2Fe-2S)-binding protein [Thalassobium sp.]
MYVCLCKAVTQQQIEQAVEQGDSYAQIRQKLGVGTDCGCCGQSAKQMVREHISRMPPCEFAVAS